MKDRHDFAPRITKIRRVVDRLGRQLAELEALAVPAEGSNGKPEVGKAHSSEYPSEYPVEPHGSPLEVKLTLARSRIAELELATSRLETRIEVLEDERDELEERLAAPDPAWLAEELADAILRNPSVFVEYRIAPRILDALGESRRLASA